MSVTSLPFPTSPTHSSTALCSSWLHSAPSPAEDIGRGARGQTRLVRAFRRRDGLRGRRCGRGGTAREESGRRRRRWPTVATASCRQAKRDAGTERAPTSGRAPRPSTRSKLSKRTSLHRFHARRRAKHSTCGVAVRRPARRSDHIPGPPRRATPRSGAVRRDRRRRRPSNAESSVAVV